jgi:hypothetical protein
MKPLATIPAQIRDLCRQKPLGACVTGSAATSAHRSLRPLCGVRAAAWGRPGSIAAGTSAGGKVIWCAPGEGSDPEIATVLIGHDDEVWDIAFLIPVALVEKVGILASARRLD